MGDRTPIEAIVYSCPPERVNALLEVFEEFGLGHEFVLPWRPSAGARQRQPPAASAGSSYAAGTSTARSRPAPARRSPRHCPPTQHGRSGEDPKFEHLGEVHLNHHPDLGLFVADCDAQGRPVFTSDAIDRLVERTDADRVQLGHLTGRT